MNGVRILDIMVNVRFILASASPRRRELLSLLMDNFEVIPSNIKEINLPGISPEDMALHNALEKALDVESRHKGAMVLGADTIVVLGDAMMGKPADVGDAIHMLKSLYGRTHRVITGVALVYGERQIVNSCVSYVTFKDLDSSMVEHYVKEKKPLDKAGAYGIQEVRDSFISNLEGDFNNVVGLPTVLVAEMIQDMKMFIED